MALPVNVYVVSDVSPNPGIPGVMVGVFDPATFAEVAVIQSDSNGLAAFLLEPGVYEVRLQKLMTRFLRPYRMEVTLTGPNGFIAPGTLLSFSAPLDPSVCRCFCRLMSLSNKPLVNSMVKILAKVGPGLQTPKLLNDNVVAAEGQYLRTDSDGFFTVDLPRGGEFYITWAGEDDQVWNFTVPDLTVANLTNLIFPYPLSLTWNPTEAPGDAVTLAVGETKTVHWTMDYTDNETLDTGSAWLEFTNPDTTLATLSLTEGSVGLLGVAPGVVVMTGATRVPTPPPTRYPIPAIVIPPLTVTVTP